MVLQEPEEVAGRVAQRGHRVAGPHGGDHRRQEVRGEVRGEPAARGELSQGHLRRALGQGEQRPGGPVEPGHLGQHPQVGAAEYGAGAGEQSGGAPGARVLETAPLAAHGHAHLRLLGVHLQFVEEPQEVRIRPPVVHDEPRVDAVCPAVRRAQVVGVRVTADALVRLQERHVVRFSQDVRGGQSRHPAAHYGCSPPLPCHSGSFRCRMPGRGLRERPSEVIRGSGHRGLADDRNSFDRVNDQSTGRSAPNSRCENRPRRFAEARGLRGPALPPGARRVRRARWSDRRVHGSVRRRAGRRRRTSRGGSGHGCGRGGHRPHSPAVKDFAVRNFGTDDKLVLQLGILVLLAVFAMAVGVLALRYRWTGAAAVLVFGVVGSVAAGGRPEGRPTDALPSAVGALVAAGVLYLLVSGCLRHRSASRGWRDGRRGDGRRGTGRRRAGRLRPPRIRDRGDRRGGGLGRCGAPGPSAPGVPAGRGLRRTR